MKSGPSLTNLNRGELDLVEKLYQDEILERVFYNFSKNNDTNKPYVIELDPTTACNLGCPDCISSSILGSGGFKTERLIEIGQEIIDLGVRAVVLIGGGEPMMHPGIDRLINLLSENNVALGLTTNGLFLDKYSDILRGSMRWVRVSVDSASSEMYKIVRPDKQGNSLFENLIDQMRNYGQKERLGIFGYSFLLLSGETKDKKFYTNATEIYEAAKLAKNLGCDYFEIKPSFDSSHFHVSQDHFVVETAINQIHQAADLQDDNFQVYGATNLLDVLNSKPTIQIKEYTQCNMLSMRALINPLGVFPCPYFRGDLNKSYGDPALNSITEIWSSSKKEGQIKNIDPSVDCKFHCIRHNSNLEIEKINSDPEIAKTSSRSTTNRFM